MFVGICLGLSCEPLRVSYGPALHITVNGSHNIHIFSTPLLKTLFSKCHFVANAVRWGGPMALWEKPNNGIYSRQGKYADRVELQ